MHRLVALLVCLSLIRVAFVGGVAACGTHAMADMSHEGGVAAAGPVAHPMTMSHRDASAHVAVASGEEPADHAAPVSSDCCGAAASCSLLAIVRAVDAHDEAEPGTGASHAEPVARRIALAVAPELPPPRA